MAATTEKEWTKHIIDNWNSYGKPWITKEDVLDNPIISTVLKPDDFVKSKKRNEPVYIQQIGNIVSHKNTSFEFDTIGRRKVFRPKASLINETEVQKYDNEMILNFQTGSSLEKLAESLKERPKKVTKKISAKVVKFESSQQLKAMVKEYKKHSCEFGCDMNINSFIFEGRNYTEAHHVIPIKNQEAFPNTSLDVPENLVVLCPKHHREFHHSTSSQLSKLFDALNDEARNFIKSLGIESKDLKNWY